MRLAELHALPLPELTLIIPRQLVLHRVPHLPQAVRDCAYAHFLPQRRLQALPHIKSIHKYTQWFPDSVEACQDCLVLCNRGLSPSRLAATHLFLLQEPFHSHLDPADLHVRLFNEFGDLFNEFGDLAVRPRRHAGLGRRIAVKEAQSLHCRPHMLLATRKAGGGRLRHCQGEGPWGDWALALNTHNACEDLAPDGDGHGCV